MAQPTQQVQILRVRNLSPHVRELVVRPLERKIPFKAGQWVSFHLPVGSRPPLVRAYTVAEPERQSGELVVVFDRVPGGQGSGYLWTLKEGDQIAVAGPLGNFVLPDPLTKDLLFVARYTGIVPIRCMIRQLVERDLNRPLHLVYWAPNELEAIYDAEFQDLARSHPSFRYLPLVGAGDPAHGDAAVQAVIDRLRALVGARKDFLPMVCGLKAFVRPVRAFLIEMGYERKAVRVENYD